MRKIVFFILVFEILSFNSQTKTFYPNTKIKVTLPGVVQVNDSLFCDIDEMNNLGYREFFWAKIIHDYCLKNNVDSLIKSKSFSIVINRLDI
ncbi:MAG: hypothetical protein ACK5UE_11630 [Chitinophagales bacterium]|jgi:hypothetical protein|nr:hypothetical protein [Sphingobacteriales bacterium]